jgi:hypothetical protein
MSLSVYTTWTTHKRKLWVVAKRRQAVPGPIDGVIWMSSNFFEEPKRRSWPGPVTRLERIAERAGLNGDEYRMLLREAIQARLREKGEAWERLDRTLEMRENGH